VGADDACRKALKVADLKEVLTKAGEKPAAKATKADLVAKILATPAALDAFTKEHGGAGASTAEQVRVRRVSSVRATPYASSRTGTSRSRGACPAGAG
jgi:hypothetical protein